MKNKVINIIRPIGNSAEKEYLKEFFRFIGCFLSDWTVDEKMEINWNRWLKTTREEGSVEILINFFGNDPYRQECQLRGINRIYCYFSFSQDKMYGKVTDQPLVSDQELPSERNKAPLRQNVLNSLIEAIWSSDPTTLKSILNIANAYVGNSQGDLFYYLQAKRSLRFLTMGEVLNEPDARINQIKYVPYIRQTMEAMWELYVKLEGHPDAYSRYTRLKAASTIREIASRLNQWDQNNLNQIEYRNRPFCIPSQAEMVIKIKELIKDEPQFLSAYLCMAGQCRNMPDGDQGEENCYLRILQEIPNGRADYAFIHYRIGYYFEKKHGNTQKATEFYRSALLLDPEYYQALFKLGYFAAKDGRFAEAESMLTRTIRSIFHGRSPEPDSNGTYPNWLALSIKESQYAFKVYMLLAKISINSNRENSARGYVGKACLAATRFDEAGLVRHISSPFEITRFLEYHKTSEPVWAIWRVLKPWSAGIVQDPFVRNIVQERLFRWNR